MRRPMAQADPATRASRRVPAGDVKAWVKFQEGSAYLPAHIRDLGLGGAFVYSTRSLPLSTPVSLQLSLAATPEVALSGEVAHVVPLEAVSPSMPAGMGVRFLHTSHEDKRWLIHAIRTLERVHPIPTLEKTVIVVDDDRETRELMQAVLELEGFRVKLAPNGLRLFSTLHIDRPSAILLDVRMSWIDGFELCQALKRNPQYQTIPVVFISGCRDAGSIERGRRLGAVDYFTKPIDLERLVRRVREIVDAPSPEATEQASP